MKPLRCRTLCLVLAPLAGCGDPARPLFTTQHLEVEAYGDELICQGTLQNMEAQTLRVAEFLGARLPSIIYVSYGSPAVDEYCGGEYGGCTSGNHVSADYYSIYHELVHAVRYGSGVLGTRFFEEGIAEVLEGFRPQPESISVQAGTVERGPERLALLSSDEFLFEDYPVAGHFMSWLRLTYGDEQIVSFLNDEGYASVSDVEGAFLKHFGLTLKEADSEWRASSELEYVWGGVCDPDVQLVWGGSSIEFVGRVACDDPGTVGFGPTKTLTVRSRCFVLDQPLSLSVEFMAGAGLVRFSSVDCQSAGGLTPEHFQVKKVLAGRQSELPFAPCVWEVAVESSLEQPTDFVVRLSPT